MALGPLIDVPSLAVPFGLLAAWRKSIVNFIVSIKLPKILLALLCAIPLTIFEEHINCGGYGCSGVIVPPTLWFLLVIELFLFGVVKTFGIKKIFWQTVLCSLLGVLYEFFLGSSHMELHSLLLSHPMVFFFITLWVGFSYAFMVFLPLLILDTPKPAV